jgi:hypothetical protein
VERGEAEIKTVEERSRLYAAMKYFVEDWTRLYDFYAFCSGLMEITNYSFHLALFTVHPSLSHSDPAVSVPVHDLVMVHV